MNATLLSFDRRGLRRSSLVLLGAAALAACDNDRPLGPNRADMPTAAALAKKSATGGTVVITIVDQNQQPVASAGAQLTLAKLGQATITAVDNGQNDADAATGVIKVQGLTGGTYNVCETAAPADYVLSTSPTCASASVTGGGTTQLQFVNLTVARVSWSVVDFTGNLIGGMTFTAKDSALFSPPMPITDNLPPDLDPTPGRIEVKVSFGGGLYVCELTPPPGYVFPPAQDSFCLGTPTPHGQTTHLADFLVHPEYSAYWFVTDGSSQNGFPGLVGPSTFQIVAANNPFTATIVDNGLNDFWTSGLGKLAIKLPAEGVYSLCQTVPPVKHLIAITPCVRFSVRRGEPAIAGWFESLPQ